MKKTVLPNSNTLINEIASSLILMADQAEGLKIWKARHGHVRLLAHDIYGGTEEASLFGAILSLRISECNYTRCAEI